MASQSGSGNVGCSDIPLTDTMNKTKTVAVFQAGFEEEIDSTFNVQKSKDFFNSCPSEQKEVFKKACKNFVALSDKKGDQDVMGYGFCCKANDICPPPFYTQIWFFAACGGSVLLLIIIILIVIICCRKK
ncbi:hypothetical protein B9Z55_007976 [Caenorhabditis nigoni]|uniref:Uncharacterized protein n=1 Tax=Caenorhabditis nigoni TaxID=1611254 RepID=A0A2G5VC83_9PELO|nr:hypothetical protein B9Z55_007976 [Caenorhabditis nigoni]